MGQGAQDLSGYSVGAAGDLNGDGLADLIVGAPGYDAAHGSVQTGRSYIIFGSKKVHLPLAVPLTMWVPAPTTPSPQREVKHWQVAVFQQARATTPSLPVAPMFCWAAWEEILSQSMPA